VLLASTNVFGEESDKKPRLTTRPDSTNSNDSDDLVKLDRDNLDRQDVDTARGDRKSTQRVTVTTSERKPVEVDTAGKSTQSVVVTTENKPTEVDTDHKSTQRVKVTTSERKTTDIDNNGKSTQRVVVTTENKPSEVDTDHKSTQRVTVTSSERKPVEVDTDGKSTQRVTVTSSERKPVEVDTDGKSTQRVVVTTENKPTEVDTDRKSTQRVKVTSTTNLGEDDTDRKAAERLKEEAERPKEETSEPKPVDFDVDSNTGELSTGETSVFEGTTLESQSFLVQPDAEFNRGSENSVHITGNIAMVKDRSPVIEAAQYDLKDGLFLNGNRPIIQSSQTFAQEHIVKESSIMLYVATSKTLDRKLAFASFPVKFNDGYFPISFDIYVELPNQQRGLLDRADITLYLFAYIYNDVSRTYTFIPAGHSQIFLQGTHQVVQKLDVFVKPSGIEINGLFRGRFGEKYIRSGTAFQVFIISEESLTIYRTSSSFESVAQITINNVPAMYPLPFSLLVQNQSLKPNMKYYAVAFIFENGVRRLLDQAPIWVINQQQALVASQFIFNVAPAPFILRGSVTRSMPGLYFVQSHSTLIVRLREIGTESGDILFKLQGINTLPQVFRINVSKSPRFDPSKNYDVSAFLTDENQKVYMGSLQSIPLLDEVSNLIIPLDDLVYNVQVRLHASSNQLLNYIPGSKAVMLVTESPESPTEPIATETIESISSDFREFSIQIPATSIQRGRNYYLVMMIEISGIITHISKILLISNNQPPPLVIQLPVLSHNLIRGVIFDMENRPAQWSSSSYATLYLLDDTAENPDKAIVQFWKIHLENEFPVRFEVQLDFSRILPHRMYRLQAAIENGRSLLEYKPAGSVLVLNSNGLIMSDVRVPVHNIKTFQLVNGLVYINGMHGPLPEKGEIVIQLSSSPSLTHPSIIDEIRINVDGRQLPVEFSMNLTLTKIDMKSVYYFIVQYVVRGDVIIPASQTFAFSPHNEATIVLTISKTEQILITGQVTSTGGPLSLPTGATLRLYITDSADNIKSLVVSEVSLLASLNSLYQFTMNVDSTVFLKKIPLYLHADILYQNEIILSIPRPPLLQIAPGGEWNIDLRVDLPTLLIGKIISLSQHEVISGEFEVYIQIFQSDSTDVVHTSRLRLDADLPQKFRIELDSELFVKYSSLKARALIKNCKEQILFESGSSFNIFAGVNVNVDLTVVLTNPQRLQELHTNVNEISSLYTGIWQVSVVATNTDKAGDGIAILDNNFTVEKEKLRFRIL
jgi:uncharacterized lipoprotein YbaY